MEWVKNRKKESRVEKRRGGEARGEEGKEGLGRGK